MGMEVKNAKGMKGFLLLPLKEGDDTVLFRVYNKDMSYVDYQVDYYDLEIEILSEDARIYEDKYIAY